MSRKKSSLLNTGGRCAIAARHVFNAVHYRRFDLPYEHENNYPFPHTSFVQRGRELWKEDLQNLCSRCSQRIG
jgi:hypothetical protein